MKSMQQIYREFLLGRLPDAEREALESRFLGDAEVFDEIEATETDLLDEWARGELAPADREALERAYSASPRLAERARIAKALVDRAHAAAAAPRQTPGWSRRWLLAASLTGVALLSWWTASLELGEAPAGEKVARIHLWGETLRSQGNAETVRLTSSLEKLVLEIELGEGTSFPRYEVELKGPAEAEVWSSSSLEPMQLDWGAALVAEVPADVLVAGEYQVGLRGWVGDSGEWLAFYALQVERPPS